MRELTRRLKSSEALTWPAAIIVIVMVYSLGPAYTSLSAGGSEQEWRKIFFITTLVYFVYVVVAKFTFLRGKSIRQRPLLSAASLIFSGLVISLGTRMIAVYWLDLEPNRIMILRIITISIAVIVWHLALAVLVHDERTHRAELEGLLNAIESASISEKFATLQLLELRNKTIQQIENTLTGAWKNLKATRQISAELIDVVNFVVRPLGREISKIEVPELGPHASVNTKITWREKINRWKNHLDTLSIYDNVATPIAVAIVPYMSRNLIAAPLGAERGVLLSFLLFFSLATLGKKLDFKIKLLWSLKWRARLAVTLVVSACFVDAYLFSVLFSKANIQLSMIAVAGNLMICSIIFFIRLLNFDRKKIIEELQVVSRNLFWSQARLKQLVWVERQRLSNLVHGHIQSQIIATAANFETQNLTDRETVALFKKLRIELQKIIRDQSRTESVPKLLRSLKKLWMNSVDIRWTISEEARKVLKLDQNAADSVIEIIRESILNSVKHARAQVLIVDIKLAESKSHTIPSAGFLILNVTNDGRPIPKKVTKGQGLAFLDLVAAEWHLLSSSTETQLTARVAFQN